MNLKDLIRDVPDFPEPGILFKDITPLLKAPAAFRYVIDRFADHYRNRPVDVILGIEARGFLFAAPLALQLGKPLVPVRKKGKLPFTTHSVEYALEYGEAAVEVHTDAVAPGERVLLVDDVLATGGTLAAGAQLIEAVGGQVAGLAVLIELVDLHGRDLLGSHDLLSLVQYP
ncbi:MAG: adenine phosphoribosyltransferase [Chloroflexi bacterium]|nr:adenine phosphoribosyltransferase [Chloroflexota bacterium]